MGELNRTLHQLSLAQHVLALLFLLSYGVALGSMFGARGRLRAVLLALLAAAGFATLTQPWEHGVLLVLCAVGGVGLFIALAWAFSALGASVRFAGTSVAGNDDDGRSPSLRAAATLTVAKATQAVKRRRRPRTV